MRSTLIVAFVIQAFLALILLFYRMTRKTYPGFGLWTAGVALLSLGYLSMCLRGHIPYSVSVLVVNAAFPLAMVFHLDGMRRFLGLTRISQLWYALPAGVVAAKFLFYYGPDTQGWSTLVLSAAVCGPRWVTAFLILSAPARPKSIFYVVIGSLLTLAGAMILGSGIWAFLTPNFNFLFGYPVQFAFLVSMTVLQMGENLSFLMLNSERVESELVEADTELRTTVDQLRGALAEQKRAEKALRESESRYRTLFDNNTDGILIADAETKCFIYANPSVCRMLGYTHEELRSLRVSDIHPSDQLTRAIAEFEIHARGERATTQNLPCLRKDGTVFFADITSAPAVLNGRACNVGFFRDITDRNKAEEDLRASEKRYRELVENSNDIVFQINTEGLFTFVNRATCRISGYSEEELVGLHFTDLILPEYREETQKFYGRQLVKKIPSTYYEFPYRTKNGEVKWVGQNVQSITRKDEIVGFQSIARDITRSKTLELALQESEERYRILAENALVGVYLHQDSYLVYANRRLEEMLGYTADELTKMTLWEIFHPDVREEVEARGLARYRGGEEPSLYASRIVTKDGETRWVEVSAVSTQYRGKVATTGALVDITERKRAEEDREESLSLLQAALESTADGILVIDAEGKIASYNTGFARMWHIPKQIIESGSDDDALGFVLDQLTSPEEFLNKVRELYGQPDAESFDVLEFKDGRIFERYSRPQRLGENVVGRVWSFRDVTKRRLAEAALQASEHRYRSIFNNAAVGITLASPEGVLLEVNQALTNILGYSQHELSKLSYLDISHPDDVEISREKHLALERGELDTYRIEKRYLGKDCRVIWVDTSVTALRDSLGKLSATVGIVVDISERIKAEQELRESELRYRMLFDNNPDGILIADVETKRFAYANPFVCRMFGYTPEELRTLGVADIHPHDQLPRVMDEFETQARGKRVLAPNLPCLRKDGTVFYADITTTAAVLDGRACNVGFFRDVTVRKESEEALRKSEEFNRRLVDHAPFGMVYLAGDGTIEYTNPVANRIGGIPEGQASPLVGLNIRELPGLLSQPEVQESLSSLFGGESISDLEVPYRSSMGRDTVLLVAATPRFGTNRDVAGAILMFTDISQRKRAEELQRETARFRAVADLAGGVAHNFNNLLQVVIGYMELALMDLETGNYTDIKDSLQKVLENSKSGAETVRRLQSFAGIRDHSQVPDRGVFDLSGIVREAVEMSKAWWKGIPEKQGRKVSLDMHLQDGCLVQGEKNELFEVVVNLIKNATEALTQDGAIEVETRVEGDLVILKVQDTGIGIGEQNLKRLFNPFFTTKAAAGAGLGLAAGRKIIEECGGNVLVDSSEGKGTTFTVVLPLIKEELKSTRTGKTLANGQPLRVLVIDDEEAILGLLKGALTRHNCEVFTALSSENGLDIFDENLVELVICDLGMPGMNGWEVGKRIRAKCMERGIKKTPFMLLTGWGGQKTEEEKKLESGVEVVMEKPLIIENLSQAVREVAERSL